MQQQRRRRKHTFTRRPLSFVVCSCSTRTGRSHHPYGETCSTLDLRSRQVPCADPTGSRTASLVTRYSWYLVPIPLAAAALDATSWMFAVEGTAFNAYLLYHAYRFDRDKSNANARGVFKASLWHLPAVLALFVFHSRRWELEDKAEDEQLGTLIQRTRARLTKLCLHEIVQKDEAASFCPVVVVEEAGTEAQNIATTAAHKKQSLRARSDTGS